MNRREFLAGSAAVLSTPRLARAQIYPTRPIRIIAPFTPGSPVDTAARVIIQQLSFGQSMVIENRPGGGTTIGAKAAAIAPPDGYTLLCISDAMCYYPVLYPNLDFDPLKDLTPIAVPVAWSHLMVVSPNVPATTVAELVTYAKANPGKLIFGFGLGTSPQIVGTAFKNAAGIDLNFIPYRGGEQARMDLLGGRVDINFAPVANLLPIIQDGKARPLAFTGLKRTPHLPDVPTMTESGYPQASFNPDSWQGFFRASWYAARHCQQAQRGDQPSPKIPRSDCCFIQARFRGQARDAGRNRRVPRYRGAEVAAAAARGRAQGSVTALREDLK